MVGRTAESPLQSERFCSEVDEVSEGTPALRELTLKPALILIWQILLSSSIGSGAGDLKPIDMAIPLII